jgi:hypothetical protein
MRTCVDHGGWADAGGSGGGDCGDGGGAEELALGLIRELVVKLPVLEVS